MLELFLDSPAIFVAVIFALGLIIGSFLNVVVFRLPLMMERDWRQQAEALLQSPAPELPEGRFNIIVPRSRCPSCGQPIAFWQNIPVLSYLLLGAQCASCRADISVRYPFVETAAAILAAIAAWQLGPGLEAMVAVGITFALIAISLIDYDHQIIPDSIVIPLLWAGLLMSLLHPAEGAMALFVSPRDSIIGAVAGYLSLWSVYQLFKLVTGKEGMGYGDFKLLAALGAWLGWQALPSIILMSALVGALVGGALILFRGRDRQLPIPFGPYLAAAGWIMMLWGDSITHAYLDTFV